MAAYEVLLKPSVRRMLRSCPIAHTYVSGKERNRIKSVTGRDAGATRPARCWFFYGSAGLRAGFVESGVRRPSLHRAVFTLRGGFLDMRVFIQF